jgi:hypothetical protein
MDQDILLVLDADEQITAHNPAAAAAGLRVGGAPGALLRGWDRRPGRCWLAAPPHWALEALATPDGGWVLWLGISRPGPAQGLRLAAAERLGSVLLHELNNALMVILGQTEMGLRAAPAAQHLPLQRVQAVGQRLLPLTQAVAGAAGPSGQAAAPRVGRADEPLAALLGPHRLLQAPDPADPSLGDRLAALSGPALGLLGATARLLPPTAWRLHAPAEAPSRVELRREAGGAAGDLPRLTALDRALRAQGGQLRPLPEGEGWAIDLPTQAPRRHALIGVYEPDLHALLAEAIVPRPAHRIESLGALDAAMEQLGEAAVLVLDAEATQKGRLPPLTRLRARYPSAPILYLGPMQGNDPRITSLNPPLQLSAVRAALDRLDQLDRPEGAAPPG